MVYFAETNQIPPPYSMFQHIDRPATPKPVPGNCLRYLQTTLITGGRGGGLVSELIRGIEAFAMILDTFTSILQHSKTYS